MLHSRVGAGQYLSAMRIRSLWGGDNSEWFCMLSSTLSLTSALEAFQIYIVVVLVTITLHLLGRIEHPSTHVML